MSVDINNRFML